MQIFYGTLPWSTFKVFDKMSRWLNVLAPFSIHTELLAVFIFVSTILYEKTMLTNTWIQKLFAKWNLVQSFFLFASENAYCNQCKWTRHFWKKQFLSFSWKCIKTRVLRLPYNCCGCSTTFRSITEPAMKHFLLPYCYKLECLPQTLASTLV